MKDRVDPRRAAIKAKLGQGAAVRLVNPMYASGALVEFLSRRFDLILFDCEHRGFDFETIDNLARAARTGQAATIVRPWSDEPGLLARFLHCGVDGLMLPHVETAEQVQAVADLAVTTRPADAASLILLALIESARGCENLEAILRIQALDGVVVGPHDLAVSLGLPRHSDDPRVASMSIEVVRRARAAGKSASAPARLGPEELRRAGSNITLTDVNTLLRRAASLAEE